MFGFLKRFISRKKDPFARVGRQAGEDNAAGVATFLVGIVQLTARMGGPDLAENKLSLAGCMKTFYSMCLLIDEVVNPLMARDKQLVLLDAAFETVFELQYNDLVTKPTEKEFRRFYAGGYRRFVADLEESNLDRASFFTNVLLNEVFESNDPGLHEEVREIVDRIEISVNTKFGIMGGKTLGDVLGVDLG